MSSYGINVPVPSQIDYHSDLCQQRREAALKSLDISHVLSVIDDLISQEVDPHRHPCFPLVAWLLDRQLSVDGGAFWDAWKRLAHQAIDRLVEARLQGED
jgi:hypothetical protein